MESTHTHEEPNYMGVFYALVVLTGAELGLSQMTDTFGRTRVVVGLVVLAFTKAAMVALWYMHLKFEGRLLYVVCFAPIVLVCVLLAGTTEDVARPDELIPLFGKPFPRTHLTAMQSPTEAVKPDESAATEKPATPAPVATPAAPVTPAAPTAPASPAAAKQPERPEPAVAPAAIPSPTPASPSH